MCIRDSTCALLGISLSWFYKWIERAARPDAERGLFTTRAARRDVLDRAVKGMFITKRGLHGSPRLVVDLRAQGWICLLYTSRCV